MVWLLDIVHLSVGALLPATGALVAAGHRVRNDHPALSLVLLLAMLLGAAGIVVVTTGRPPGPAGFIGAMLLGVVVIRSAPNWNAIGHACFTIVLLWTGSYLLYAGWLAATASPTGWLLGFAMALMLLVMASLLLMVAHAFEVVDVLCRIRWNRRFAPPPLPAAPPMVSLHVPAYNEPPHLVMQTLSALAALDYPRYEVIVVDDNTPDPATWQPVREHCRRLGFRFYHLENWPGYKSGALNHALAHAAPEARIIGVIDADYLVEPDYLSDLVGFFENPKVAFVQTPQDYRDVHRSRYQAALYRSYQYFFKLSMASRNERNGIIFTGTMGLIRREPLEAVGGWNEWCITEDAEVALKMLDLGLESVFIDRSYGRGLMPLDFAGLRRQRFRWAFGGMQVLRLHWRKLLPGSRLWNPGGQLRAVQKYDYWAGALQWLNDPLTFLFTGVLLLCALAYTGGSPILVQPFAASVVFMPFLFVAFGVLKMLWGLRIRLGCSLADAHRAFLILLSLTWVVTMACTLGLVRRRARFMRTPKEGRTPLRTMRVAGTECLLAAGVLGTVGWVAWRAPSGFITVVLCGLLLWQVYIYGSAWVVNRWSRCGPASEQGRKLDAPVAGVLPVRAPFVAEGDTDAARAAADHKHQARAVTPGLVPAQTDRLPAEGDMRRRCPQHPRASP